MLYSFEILIRDRKKREFLNKKRETSIVQGVFFCGFEYCRYRKKNNLGIIPAGATRKNNSRGCSYGCQPTGAPQVVSVGAIYGLLPQGCPLPYFGYVV